jgi:hypothetical protein
VASEALSTSLYKFLAVNKVEKQVDQKADDNNYRSHESLHPLACIFRAGFLFIIPAFSLRKVSLSVGPTPLLLAIYLHDQAFGRCLTFTVGDHPAGNAAAEDVDDDLYRQRQIHSFGP